MNKLNLNINAVTGWLLFFAVAGTGWFSCTPHTGSPATVKTVMDRVVTDLYDTAGTEELSQISEESVFSLFSDDELVTLSTKHWMFDVNVPVVVSVMRSTRQEHVPFWLTGQGFTLTGEVIKNEQTTYEVWEKNFPKGRVGLGINGFENYGLHYFVSVAPQEKGAKLEPGNFFPASQHVGVLDDGAFTYHDWTELVVREVPETMKGRLLLTTVRGRGVESHLIGAFRSTAHPSSEKPDQLMVTWSSDPSTTIDIQWRTSATVDNGTVIIREINKEEIKQVPAEKTLMEDRLLMNDRYIHRHTAKITGLKPGTTYQYLILPESDWSKATSFTTASAGNQFSFLWFGDTHNSPFYGEILARAWENHDDIAFMTISGDLVNDGLHRNQWDDLFALSGPVISSRPLMAVPGNHDNRAGLGAGMFRDMFSYPLNGPDGVPKEQTYSFTYQNCHFLMLDATSSWEGQTDWLEAQLSGSTATWKIAIFHFPPYNHSSPYVGIQQAWVPLFDKYHVDLVMGGHLHYYMRSHPMKGGKVAGSFREGTVYAISIAIPGRKNEIPEESYAAVRDQEGHLYQYISVNQNTLTFKSANIDDKVIDEFIIVK
jgi:acid phosphatase type 7